MVSRTEFVGHVLTYLDTPFHHQGRLPGVGMDCPAPLICAARHFGIKPQTFDVTSYPRLPDGRSLRVLCEEFMTEIPQTDMQPGDAVLVAWGDGEPQHLGVVVPYKHGGLSMIHAESFKHKKVVETRLVFGRHMRFVAAYKVPGVE